MFVLRSSIHCGISFLILIVGAPFALAAQPISVPANAASPAVTETDGRPTPPSGVLELDTAIAEALRTNPGLAQSQARAHAMAEIPSQAGALPDPRLTLGALNVPVDTYKFDQEPMTQKQVGISQEFPYFGKRGLREKSAAQEADVAALEVKETRLRLIRDVKSVWWNLSYLDRALEIVQRNREMLRQFVSIAETKYKVGRGLQQDVLLAQLELTKLFEMEIQLRGKRRGQEARLNALLNRPSDMTVHLPSSVTEDLPPPGTEPELLREAMEVRPMLLARRSQLEAARARLDLARKDYAPNIMVNAAYGFREGKNANGTDRPDFASLQLSLNLPLYAGAKQSKAVAQRVSELTEREFALQDSQQQVQAEIARNLADYERARTQTELFKAGIIPLASQTVSSMLAGYQVNKVDFLNLIRAQITLYNYEIQYWQTLSEANQTLAALTAATGKEQTHE
jgi:outer membrane protein, heavy metal efflux system